MCGEVMILCVRECFCALGSVFAHPRGVALLRQVGFGLIRGDVGIFALLLEQLPLALYHLALALAVEATE